MFIPVFALNKGSSLYQEADFETHFSGTSPDGPLYYEPPWGLVALNHLLVPCLCPFCRQYTKCLLNPKTKQTSTNYLTPFWTKPPKKQETLFKADYIRKELHGHMITAWFLLYHNFNGNCMHNYEHEQAKTMAIMFDRCSLKTLISDKFCNILPHVLKKLYLRTQFFRKFYHLITFNV